VAAFETPPDEVKLDRAAIPELSEMPDVEVSDKAHREEHGLEVQLTFLQATLDTFTLVPVVVGNSDRRSETRVAHRASTPIPRWS
jgi:AmmeMemoRadiSam system protein B